MLMTLSGMVTLVRLVQPLKAYSPMVATLVGDRYAYQATAAAEGPQPNVGNAVGDRVMTTFPSRKLNQYSFVFVEQNPVLRRIFGVTFAYLNARQTTAAIED